MPLDAMVEVARVDGGVDRAEHRLTGDGGAAIGVHVLIQDQRLLRGHTGVIRPVLLVGDHVAADTLGLSLLRDLDLLDGVIGAEGHHDHHVAAVALAGGGDDRAGAVVGGIDAGDILHRNVLHLSEAVRLRKKLSAGGGLSRLDGRCDDGAGHAVGSSQRARHDHTDHAQDHNRLKDAIPVVHFAAPSFFFVLAMPRRS